MISTEYTHCSLGTRYTNAAQSCTKGSCPHSLRLALLVQMTLKHKTNLLLFSYTGILEVYVTRQLSRLGSKTRPRPRLDDCKTKTKTETTTLKSSLKTSRDHDLSLENCITDVINTITIGEYSHISVYTVIKD